jgi:hypothetical protein
VELAELPFEIRWPATRASTFLQRGDLDAARAQLDVATKATEELDDDFGRLHVAHLRARLAFYEGDLRRSRTLHNQVLARCHELEFLGGMGSVLCDLAIIDLTEGDVEGAVVRHQRGLACYEEGGYLEHAERARDEWSRAAAS